LTIYHCFGGFWSVVFYHVEIRNFLQVKKPASRRYLTVPTRAAHVGA
jgi:hypothetical protein